VIGGLDAQTLVLGLFVFLARVTDVSLGTIRTISTVQGRTRTAFLLGFAEVSIWLFVIAAIIADVRSKPVLWIFYALGFSTGNVVGILLERRLAFGHVVVRIFSRRKGAELAGAVRRAGHPVTTFEGSGGEGPVTEVCIACRRRDLHTILSTANRIEPGAFHVIEFAGTVSRLTRPLLHPPTGWRAIFKKK